LRREGEEYVPEGLDPKVVEVYQGVGKVLSRYTSGKVRRTACGNRTRGTAAGTGAAAGLPLLPRPPAAALPGG
jgi:hypothetical protein